MRLCIPHNKENYMCAYLDVPSSGSTMDALNTFYSKIFKSITCMHLWGVFHACLLFRRFIKRWNIPQWEMPCKFLPSLITLGFLCMFMSVSSGAEMSQNVWSSNPKSQQDQVICHSHRFLSKHRVDAWPLTDFVTQSGCVTPYWLTPHSNCEQKSELLTF